jgi:hypothetical protein
MKAVLFNQFGGRRCSRSWISPIRIRVLARSGLVRAAGVNPSDWKKRKGLMDGDLPQTIGHEAAGVVDELGEGVADVTVGDRVFGFSSEGVAQAELAVLSDYAPIPPSLGGANANAVSGHLGASSLLRTASAPRDGAQRAHPPRRRGPASTLATLFQSPGQRARERALAPRRPSQLPSQPATCPRAGDAQARGAVRVRSASRPRRRAHTALERRAGPPARDHG